MGQSGCGKSSIIKDRLKNQAADVAEVLSLHVSSNKFTSAHTLWQKIFSQLEWKHAHTYVPKGNKKLICLVDDLNLSKVRVLSARIPEVKHAKCGEEMDAQVGRHIHRQTDRQTDT